MFKSGNYVIYIRIGKYRRCGKHSVEQGRIGVK